MVELALQCCDMEPGNRPDSESAYAWIEDLLNNTPQDGPDPPLPNTPEFPQANVRNKEGGVGGDGGGNNDHQS